MVRDPWLLIMGLLHKMKDKIILKKFQDDDDTRFWLELLNRRLGITLTAANTVIYYSNGYDLEKDYNQKTERIE